MVILSFLFFALSAQISVLRSLIIFWLSQTSPKVPVWVMRKTLASSASSAQAEWCLACTARPQGCALASVEGPTGTDRKALRFGEPEGSHSRRAGGRVICLPCGLVLLNYLGSARGRKCDYTMCFVP